MYSHFPPIPKRLRPLILLTVLFVGSLSVLPAARAQSGATATLTSGGLNSVTINQNGTFTLTLGITTSFISSGYTVFYQSNNGSGLFQITGRTSLDPLYPFPVIDPIPFPVLLNPTTAFDFGATISNPNVTHPAGTFNLQAVTINALNAPVGTYTIFLDNRSIMTDRTGGGFTDVNFGGPSGPSFTINVIPEPATTGLLAVAGVIVLAAAGRKRRPATVQRLCATARW